MNDPHVVSLTYRIDHDDTITYAAPPTEWNLDRFEVIASGREITLRLKEHYAEEGQAIAAVSTFIESWQNSVALSSSRREHFRLRFRRAEIVDRQPTPGVLHVHSARHEIKGGQVKLHLSRSKFPEPPATMFSADASALLDRYLRVKEGRAELPAAAYFCLTVLEMRRPPPQRKNAGKELCIDLDVLNTIGQLTNEAGGDQARKAKGVSRPLTEAEGRWLEEAMRKLVERVRDHDAGIRPLPQITLQDHEFPKI
jgi:hypothetical protein